MDGIGDHKHSGKHMDIFLGFYHPMIFHSFIFPLSQNSPYLVNLSHIP